MTKNILKLSPQEAKEFFLKQECYINFNLPPYFSFSPTLNIFSTKLGSATLGRNALERAKKAEQVNYTLLNNKDGKYAWRKLQIIHPALYVSLVHKMTEEHSWATLKEHFKKFQKHKSIECVSLPIVSGKNESVAANQASNWYEKFEKRSVQLGLEFSFLCQTDITDCYGSFYTHSIAWAIHTKETARVERRNMGLLGNSIDAHLQAMSYGQTNGIPQGSVLMDFIAEILLAYSDDSFYKKLTDIGVTEGDYKIIRYRDDYRIFTNDQKTGKEILKSLSEVLSELGMRLNAEKTFHSSDILSGSVKPDKLYIMNHGRDLPSKLSFDKIRKKLFFIHSVGLKFPNSGTIKKRLTKLNKKVKSKFEFDESSELLSMLVNIALHNPETFPVIAALSSKLIGGIASENKGDVIEKIRKKFELVTNTGYLDIWLQRATLKFDSSIKYEEKLCQLVRGNEVSLFESGWVRGEHKKIIDSSVFVDQKKIEDMDEMIPDSEVELYPAVS